VYYRVLWHNPPLSQISPELEPSNGIFPVAITYSTALSETDFTEDLKRIDVPTLVMHGEDDQIVPFADAGPLSAKLLKNATTKFYPGFPHGMPTTNAEQINADLLEFVTASRLAAAPAA
jgi:pimeloyl-ACP methyl ester carboxylesterase